MTTDTPAAPAAPDAPWWQRGRRLPGLSALVPGRGRRRRRGPARADRAPRTTWRALGVDAVWLSPMFRSPMRDFGYDISDYRDVDPVFGTLADLDRLVAEAHARGHPGAARLRAQPHLVAPPVVPGRAARAVRAPPRLVRVARPGARRRAAQRHRARRSAGRPGRFDEATGQYWYHSFLPEQPDLDWRNPAVREAMLDTLRFWFERGIDGFRIDVLWMIAKDDAPVARRGRDGDRRPGRAAIPAHALEHGDGPGSDRSLAELRAVADAYPGPAADRRGLLRARPPGPLLRRRGSRRPPAVQHGADHAALGGRVRSGAAVEAYETALPGHAWPNWVLGNHDQSAGREPGRGGPGAGRRDAPADAARDAGRCTRATSSGCPTCRCRPSASSTSTAAIPERSPMPWTTGPGGGVHDGRAVAADGGRRRGDAASRPSRPTRARCSPSTGGCWRSGARSRRSTRGRGRRSTRPEPVVAFDRAAAGTRFRVLLNLGPDAGRGARRRRLAGRPCRRTWTAPTAGPVGRHRSRSAPTRGCSCARGEPGPVAGPDTRPVDTARPAGDTPPAMAPARPVTTPRSSNA